MLVVCDLGSLIDVSDRADRVYYYENEKTGELVVLAAYMLWHGYVHDLDEKTRAAWEGLKRNKGVRIRKVMDIYEVVDYLRSVIKG